MNKKLQFTVQISAPVQTVWNTMLDHPGYEQWTSHFCEGSTYAGSWEKGASIHFVDPSGNGMVSEIAENIPHAFLSIRHLGEKKDGVIDTQSEKVKSWAPAYENYTFAEKDGMTALTVDTDVTPEWEQYMAEAWPKALAKLKEICEAK